MQRFLASPTVRSHVLTWIDFAWMPFLAGMALTAAVILALD